MLKRIITLSFLILNLLIAQGRSLPAFIYGPSTTAYKVEGDSAIIKNLYVDTERNMKIAAITS